MDAFYVVEEVQGCDGVHASRLQRLHRKEAPKGEHSDFYPSMPELMANKCWELREEQTRTSLNGL